VLAQVDFQIACGAVNTARLERALRNAEFVPRRGAGRGEERLV
jgi:hypothetical protein